MLLTIAREYCLPMSIPTSRENGLPVGNLGPALVVGRFAGIRLDGEATGFFFQHADVCEGTVGIDANAQERHLFSVLLDRPPDIASGLLVATQARKTIRHLRLFRKGCLFQIRANME
jgi:hypothetical protein